MQAIDQLRALSDEDLEAMLVRKRAELAKSRSLNKLALYQPYPKQAEFHKLGATKRERALIAANQVGKTLSAGMEVAIHATGLYPEWWQGHRIDHPSTWWVGGPTAEATRDGAQRMLFGRGGPTGEGSLGTGTIPSEYILGHPMARSGVPNAIAMTFVRHTSGGMSTIIMKTYDQGQERWQSDTIDGGVWFDEEPPLAIYSEGLTRTNAGGGVIMLTFTPLHGISQVVYRFLYEEAEDRAHVNMTIEEAPHYSPERRAQIIASYQPHEVEARTQGKPGLGQGRVFPYARSEISWKPVRLPNHTRWITGLDFGWDHPTAAVELGYDIETDIIYVTKCYRDSKKVPALHSAAIRGQGFKGPVAWPHDGLQHDKGSGERIATLYRKQGLRMLPEMATFPDGSNGLEAGVTEMAERMQTGRWRVAEHLVDWWEEYELYHREPAGALGLSQIVKIRDDLLSASRYGMMMMRFARKWEPIARDAYGRAPAKYDSARSNNQNWMTA